MSIRIHEAVGEIASDCIEKVVPGIRKVPNDACSKLGINILLICFSFLVLVLMYIIWPDITTVLTCVIDDRLPVSLGLPCPELESERDMMWVGLGQVPAFVLVVSGLSLIRLLWRFHKVQLPQTG